MSVLSVYWCKLGPRVAGLLFASAMAAAAGEVGPEALDALPEADVVFLGEVHDNPVHHLNQARAVFGMEPRALVFEMLTPEAALRATPDVRGDEDALADALGWAESGWPDFAMYYVIFAAAPEATIFGGEVPREEVRRAVGEGAAAVMGAGASLFGLDVALPAEEQAAREALQADAHCGALPEDVLPGMVEAQRLRDAALAQAVVAAMAETGGPVAVITGNGHARTDWGAPSMLGGVLPEATVLSVGQVETGREAGMPFDLWLVTEGVDRDDPCEAFR